MNKDHFHWNLSPLRNKTEFSPQCRKVQELLLIDEGTDHDRLRRVLDYLDGSQPINDDTFEWLKTGIRGPNDGGYVFDISNADEFEFWNELHCAYPQHSPLYWVAADARWFVDNSASVRMFMEAFEMDCSLIHTAGLDGFVLYTIEKSEYGQRFYVLNLLAIKKDYGEEEFRETIRQLRDEWADNEKGLRAIAEVTGDNQTGL